MDREKREIRERCRATLRPVAEVMPLAEADAAAWEAAATVAMMERSSQCRWNRPGPGSDLQQAPIAIVAHHHPACVARQAPGRFRGNVRPVLEDGLAWLIRIRQRLHEQRPYLRRQSPSEDHHAVLVLIHVKRAARVLPRSFPSLGLSVNSSVAADARPLHLAEAVKRESRSS